MATTHRAPWCRIQPHVNPHRARGVVYITHPGDPTNAAAIAGCEEHGKRLAKAGHGTYTEIPTWRERTA